MSESKAQTKTFASDKQNGNNVSNCLIVQWEASVARKKVKYIWGEGALE